MKQHLEYFSNRNSVIQKLLLLVLLIIQLAGLALVGNGLYSYFQFDLTNDWRMPYIWFGSVATSLVVIYVVLANLVLNLKSLSVAFILQILTFLVTVSSIVIISITTPIFKEDLGFCYSKAHEKPDSCVIFWDQMFCKQHITEQCDIFQRGFSLVVGGLCAMSLSAILLLVSSFSKIYPSFSSGGSGSSEPLLQSVDIQ